MTSSQCSVPGDVQGQTESPHASSRPPPGPPLPEPSVGEVAPEALPAQSEGVGSVSIQQGLGSAAWVGSAGGQESGGTREGSTSGHPPVATGPQTSSADEASTLHPEGPGTIDRAPSNEAIMVGDPLGPSSAAGAAAAPGDAELMAWEAEVRGGANDALPLVGELEAMEGLAEEYAGGARVFRDKILWLAGKYGALRRTRGDGNCFFRSFVFALLEQLLLSGDLEEKDRLIARLAELKRQLAEAGYEEMVTETPMDAMLDMLRSIGSPVDPLSIETLENNMRADYISNYIVFLMRMVASSEIKRRREFFAPFIMGMSDLDVDAFCRRYVDPMDEESDHIQIVALTDALRVPLRVVYLDRSGSGGPTTGGAPATPVVDMHDFAPGGAVGREPSVHLLYRPGHYDIVYPCADR